MKIQVRWPVSSNVTPEDVFLFGWESEDVHEQERGVTWVATLHASTVNDVMYRSTSLIRHILETSERPCSCVRNFVDDGEGDAMVQHFNDFLYLLDSIRNDNEYWAPDDEKTIHRDLGRYRKILQKDGSGWPTQVTTKHSSDNYHARISEADWKKILRGAGWRGRQTTALLKLTRTTENRPLTFEELEKEGISRHTPYAVNLTFQGNGIPFRYRQARNSVRLMEK